LGTDLKEASAREQLLRCTTGEDADRLLAQCRAAVERSEGLSAQLAAEKQRSMAVDSDCMAKAGKLVAQAQDIGNLRAELDAMVEANEMMRVGMDDARAQGHSSDAVGNRLQLDLETTQVEGDQLRLQLADVQFRLEETGRKAKVRQEVSDDEHGQMARNLEQALSKAATLLVENRALEDTTTRLKQQLADTEEGFKQADKSVSHMFALTCADESV
jgi:hypothetical protein